MSGTDGPSTCVKPAVAQRRESLVVGPDVDHRRDLVGPLGRADAVSALPSDGRQNHGLAQQPGAQRTRLAGGQVVAGEDRRGYPGPAQPASFEADLLEFLGDARCCG